MHSRYGLDHAITISVLLDNLRSMSFVGISDYLSNLRQAAVIVLVHPLINSYLSLLIKATSSYGMCGDWLLFWFVILVVAMMEGNME